MMVRMSADDGRERRRHVRVPLNLLIQYRFDTLDEAMSAYAADLSEGGLFIETDEPRGLGDMIYLQFALRDGTRLIEALGKVVRVIEPGGDEEPGMGVQFVSLDGDSQDLVQRAVQTLTLDLEGID